MTEQATKPRNSSHLIGGFFGGLTSAVALQPLDLLKTRIQQDKKATLWKNLKEIDSPLQLWRGTLPSALRTSIGSALYLSCLNLMRSSLAKRRNAVPSLTNDSNIVYNKSSSLPRLTMYENLLTGAFARGLVGYITMPITVIKVRYESTLYNYSSLKEAITHIYTKEGLFGFFRGFGATCLRDTPYAGLYVLLYEKSKQLLPMVLPSRFIHYNPEGGFTTYTSTTVNTTSAVLSASLATTVTAPFDTIKTRMQLEPSKFTNSFNTFTSIVKNENVLKLFSGLSMRLARKALSAGIAWGIYEELVKRFM
ncbi:Putative mitochondrial transport protein [Saccharomyces cerevisiae]|nr:ALH_1c_G0007860.mRNA.1.CDS.1 [Saccharomyces cerevisiae]CAI4325776.1 ALH_1b_G0007890.mRNA.1.CDS.1 [Saccharomyces cerevisiae]CAI5243178.1 AKR_HP2_G0008120.mRNA.1.CDS.1 [Saccharomyces cerevisiae]CAI6416995.1 AKR_HP2_G0008120.mRNA.1.CDS.1 [Saccharomyces cerevisiae]CAI6418048.1 AKR_HP1_G0007520.mRNA.1.CDS.1 [Saccharomyces cerevisiae]